MDQTEEKKEAHKQEDKAQETESPLKTIETDVVTMDPIEEKPDLHEEPKTVDLKEKMTVEAVN